MAGNRTRRRFLAAVGGTTALAAVGATRARQDADVELGGEIEGWIGRAPPSIEGETNPTLELVAGREYTIVWENLDGLSHNVVIENADGDALVESPIMAERGETQRVTFTATAEMTTYYCVVHPGSMSGDVVVTGGNGTATPTTTRTATPSPTATPTDADHVVEMRADDGVYFDPVGLHVEPGDTVAWTIAEGSHSSTSYGGNDVEAPRRIPEDADGWNSGVLADEGATFSHTFEVEGTYDYFCIPHRSLGMVGRLVVGAPGGPAEGSVPPDGPVPRSDAIVEAGAIGHADFSTPTPTPTPPPSPTPTPTVTTGTETPTPTATDGPGFGIVATLAGVGSAAAYLLRRRGDGD